MKLSDLPHELTQDAEASVPAERAASGTNVPHASAPEFRGVVVGEVIAILGDEATALVRYPGQQGTAALRARSVVDIKPSHVFASVVLAFDDGDPLRPIVMGILREHAGWPLDERPEQVDVDVDGARMVIGARDELVLRCGKASITMTRAGKVLIEGTYVLSRSDGVNRIKGGSIQLN